MKGSKTTKSLKLFFNFQCQYSCRKKILDLEKIRVAPTSVYSLSASRRTYPIPWSMTQWHMPFCRHPSAMSHSHESHESSLGVMSLDLEAYTGPKHASSHKISSGIIKINRVVKFESVLTNDPVHSSNCMCIEWLNHGHLLFWSASLPAKKISSHGACPRMRTHWRRFLLWWGWHWNGIQVLCYLAWLCQNI